MTAINKHYDIPLDRKALELALRSLAVRLDENHADPVELVVCGGSALILTGQVTRTTRDVDIVALIKHGILCTPDPLSPDLEQAIREVAEDLNLPDNWLNNKPSRGEGGLFQMGLPAGLADRLHHAKYSDRLTVHFIHRTDQIHFKLYAAADRGGYHITDLKALTPSPEEIMNAARWAMTHDVSESFAMILKELLRSICYEDIADKL